MSTEEKWEKYYVQKGQVSVPVYARSIKEAAVLFVVSEQLDMPHGATARLHELDVRSPSGAVMPVSVCLLPLDYRYEQALL